MIRYEELDLDKSLHEYQDVVERENYKYQYQDHKFENFEEYHNYFGGGSGDTYQNSNQSQYHHHSGQLMSTNSSSSSGKNNLCFQNSNYLDDENGDLNEFITSSNHHLLLPSSPSQKSSKCKLNGENNDSISTTIPTGNNGNNASSVGRKLHRFCGFLALSLSLFLIVTSLLDSDIELAYVNNGGSSGGSSGTGATTHFSLDETIISSSQASTAAINSNPNSNPRKIKRLPQCIIIGARKCGTRALIDMMNLHPQVEKAAIEVHFFDRDENYAKGLEWYRQHMPETYEDQISIEKSPSYFVTPEVPERIHGMNSSIKLLLIVREPITRVISDYTQIYGNNQINGINNKANNGSKSPKLEDLVLQSNGEVNVHYKAVRISLYSRYLQRWLDVFPPSQILVIDGDALIRDPFPQVREVERFLGLQPSLQRDNFYFNVTKGFYCWRKLEVDLVKNETAQLHCLNDSKGRRHPPVDRFIVSKLRRFYNPHNLRFYEMVGRDFGWPEK